MSTTRVLNYLEKVSLNSIGYAVWTQLNGYVGANVLELAGYEDYNSKDAIQQGLLGGGVIGILIGLLKAYLKENDLMKKEHKDLALLVEVLASPFVSELSGMLGYALLKQLLEMPFKKVVAAFAVGGGVDVGGVILAGVLVYSCYEAAAKIERCLAQNPPAPQRGYFERVTSSLGACLFPHRAVEQNPQPTANIVDEERAQHESPRPA